MKRALVMMNLFHVQTVQSSEAWQARMNGVNQFASLLSCGRIQYQEIFERRISDTAQST